MHIILICISIGMWHVGDLFEGGKVILFDTWGRRGAREADRMISRSLQGYKLLHYTIYPETVIYLQTHANFNLKFLQTFGPIGQIYHYRVFYLEASPYVQTF